MSKTKEKIVKDALAFISKYKKFPTEKDLVSLGYTRDIVRSRFGSIGGLREVLVNEGSVRNFISEESYGEEYNLNLRKNLFGKKLFIISSFVCGAEVNKKLLGNLKTLAKHYKAELLLLPILDKKAKLDKFFDPILLEERIVTEELWLNSNICVSTLAIGARAVDPSSGLPRLGQRNGSTILASTKQRLKYVPTGNISLPHALLSTGTITLPNYSNTRLFKTKDTRLSEEDHKYGAVIVEIVDKDIFHFRHIEAGPNMELADLGILVKNNKVSKIKPSALVLGDWHSGKTNSTVAKETEKLSKKLGIDKWIMHDIFDGDSINHHDEGKIITRTKKIKSTGLSIETELKGLAGDLSWMSNFLKEVVVVKSNHDEFLDQYLDKGQYVQDPHNHRISLELALCLLDNKNPLQEGVNRYLDNKVSSKIRWLGRDESYIIADIECGRHGHTGANGARPSIQTLENAYRKAVTGHSHTPQILRDIYVVGTSTDPFPDYGKGGASSWMQTHCIIYPNGTRQLINCIEGKFTNLWA